MRWIPVVVSVLAASAALAQTAPNMQNRAPGAQNTRRMVPMVNGEITGIKGATLTVKNRQGVSVNVAVSAKTVFTRQAAGRAWGQMGETGQPRQPRTPGQPGQPGMGRQPGQPGQPGMGRQPGQPGQPPAMTPPAGVTLKASDIKVGMQIMARGAYSTDRTVFNADQVIVLPNSVQGSIVDRTATTIAVKDAAGKVHFFTVTPQTLAQKNRQTAKLDDFKVGDLVAVEYDGNKATFVREGRVLNPAGGQPGANRANRANRGDRQGNRSFGLPGNTAPGAGRDSVDSDTSNE